MVVALGGIIAAAGCSSSAALQIPRFDISDESMFRQYSGLADLANISSAIVVVEPTGQSFNRRISGVAGATEKPAPVQYVKMTLVKTISGSVTASEGDEVDVVSPGVDLNTGQPALLNGGQCLLFLAPAMLDKNDALEGYVVAGGPNGVFCQADPNKPNDYTSAYASQNKTLPKVLVVGRSNIPEVTHTEAELLAIGPQ